MHSSTVELVEQENQILINEEGEVVVGFYLFLCICVCVLGLFWGFCFVLSFLLFVCGFCFFYLKCGKRKRDFKLEMFKQQLFDKGPIAGL